MGRPSNAAERRPQIVRAAVRVIARRGYDGASIQAIAKEAGLSPGLLHHHFGSKAEILHAVLEYLESLVAERTEALASRRRGAWGRLEAWIDAHLARGDGAEPEAVAAWVWVGAQALEDAELRGRYRQVVRRRLEALTELIEAVAREHGARLDARALAVTTLAAIEGYYQLASSTEVVPEGSAAPDLGRWLRRVLTGGRRA